jgi:hypothetical protein
MFMHELGKKAKDKISGFKGVIVARAEHLTGCNTYGLAPKLDGSGKKPTTEWFDEGCLDVSGKFGVKVSSVAAPRRGGPLSSVPKSTH